MKNFKNVAFGLVAGALALGFSAFTNANKQGPVYYGQTSTNHYVRLSGSPLGTCETNTTNSCTISYAPANDPGVASFDITSMTPAPAGGTSSDEKTLYNP